MQDTSGKDTDSNGKKDDGIVNKAVSGLVLETGLTPCMKKLSVGNNKTDVGDATGGVEPQPKRERKKSKSSPKVAYVLSSVIDPDFLTDIKLARLIQYSSLTKNVLLLIVFYYRTSTSINPMLTTSTVHQDFVVHITITINCCAFGLHIHNI